MQADRIHVGGTIRFLHRFTSIGEIRLLGARINGSLDLSGARVTSAEGPALDLGDAVIEGSLFLISDRTGRHPVIWGRIDMGRTRISGQLLIRDATIEKSSTTRVDSGYSKSRIRGSALSAPRLSVGAETTLEGAPACTTSGRSACRVSPATDHRRPQGEHACPCSTSSLAVRPGRRPGAGPRTLLRHLACRSRDGCPRADSQVGPRSRACNSSDLDC